LVEIFYFTCAGLNYPVLPIQDAGIQISLSQFWHLFNLEITMEYLKVLCIW